MTARSRPIDQSQLAYQTNEIYWCFDLVGISDDQLRAVNDPVRSSVRSMPLSSHGHVWKWNTGEQAQIFTVICGDELHGRGIAKTSSETCVRYPIVGLRKCAALFSGRLPESFWFFCRQPCFWLRVAATRKRRPPFPAPRLKLPAFFRKTSPSSANGWRRS